MAEETIDEAVLEQTKTQIRQLVAEIGELAESDIQPAEFQVEFMNRVVAAVAADCGALWMLDNRGTLRIAHQLQFRQTGLMDRQRAVPHEALLSLMMQAAQPQIIPPGAAVEGVPDAGNPSELALIIAPIIVEKQTIGLVEIAMDPNRRAASKKSTLRFVQDLCDLASQYIKNRQVRQMLSQQKLWGQLEGFTHAAHQSLDLKETCYSVANEGKRLIGCDRLSVAMKLGAHAKVMIEAVSGQEIVEQRSNLVREMTRLCRAVIQSGEDLVYTGNTESFPPDIRDALEIYVDESGSKAIAVSILHKPETETNKEKETFGCLIAEQIGDHIASTDMHARCEVISRHASTALWNSQEHHRIFMAPLLKAIGSPWRFFRGRTLAKILAGVGAIVTVVLALTFVPWELTIEGRGSILPEVRHMTYAPLRGTIKRVPFEHGDLVKGPHVDAGGEDVAGDVIAELESKDLERELQGEFAKLAEASGQLSSLQSQIDDGRAHPNDLKRLYGEKVGAEGRKVAAEDQIRIIEEQINMLKVRAPSDGIVTTWDVKRNFMNRPVEVGQELIQVADTSGDWVLEVNVPDHDMGPILDARSRLDVVMKPAIDAKQRLDDLCRAGVTSANAAAVSASLEDLARTLRQAEKQGAKELTDVGPTLNSLTAFSQAVYDVQNGKNSAGDAQKAKATLDAAVARATALACYFVSATDPEHRYPGYVRRIAAKAETVEQQHVVKVTVGFDQQVREDFKKHSRNQEVRPGAEVRARIKCGNARLAYVLMRDVVHFWHENVIFRWPFVR
jgi:hypothetical protein